MKKKLSKSKAKKKKLNITQPCPKCGSNEWRELRYTMQGEPMSCNDCPGVYQ